MQLVAWVMLILAIPTQAQQKFYDSKYYEVQSDLEPETVREAILHMNYMAEEYYTRTKEMATGQINRKFKFMLFGRRSAYRIAGGPDGSVGVFLGNLPGHPLAALRVPEYPPDTLWHTIQHEGFHQFTTEVISGGTQNLPIWLEEGLAEYFGYAVFTGESLIPGVIPPDRLAMVQKMMPTGRFRPFSKLISISRSGWLEVADGVDYLQVWSIVQFLVHADNNHYRRNFERYIRAASRPGVQGVSMSDFLGPSDELEEKWRQWWTAQEPDASKDLYTRAAATGLCAYLGRAAAQKQHFDVPETLLQAFASNRIKLADADWLPPSLPNSVSTWKQLAGGDLRFELSHDDKKPQVSVTLTDGTILTATYNPALATHRVKLETDTLPLELARAAALIADAKRIEAREILQSAIKANPQSTLLTDARKMIAETYVVAAAVKPKPIVPPKVAAKPKIYDVPPILVISARFGVDTHWIEVTPRFRDMVKNDTLAFPPDLASALEVDPAPGRRKYVDLIVMLNGTPARMLIAENPDLPAIRISAKSKP